MLCICLGQGSVQARSVADAMLDAVIDVLSQNTSSPLTTIRIVVFQKHMLTDFYDSMQQREGADADSRNKGGWNWGGIGSRIRGKYVEGNNFGFICHICTLF